MGVHGTSAGKGNVALSWHAARAYTRFADVSLVATACVIAVWLLAAMTGQAEDAAVTVAVTSTPALERIRPRTESRACNLDALAARCTPESGPYQAPTHRSAAADGRVDRLAQCRGHTTPRARFGTQRRALHPAYIFPSLVSTRLTWRLPLCRGAQRFLLPACGRRYASLHMPWWCARAGYSSALCSCSGA